ncbi:MAG: sigma-54-dependent Fis family transcriptional regulator, partial [Desulfofustis sp.]|nr:sigma-54-dependent Fis family transcriptional regulator [Desulfofustis sp.]
RYVLLGAQNHWKIDRLMSGSAHAEARSLAEQVERFERSLIEQALASSNGSIKKAMDALAVPRKTLSDKMRKYGLDKSDYKD